MDSATVPHRDGLGALHEANPHNDPCFEAAAAAIAQHTRQVVAAAAVGSSAGAGPSGLGRGEAGPNRRGRYLLALLIVAGAVIAALLLVTTILVPRSSHSQPASTASGPAPSQPGASATTQPAPAVPGGPATGVAPAAAPSALPSTATSLPSPTAASTGPTATGGQKGSTAGRSTVTTTAPTARPTPTTASSPPSSTMSSAAPTCAPSPIAPGPPAHQSVSVQDLGSGLASISNVAITNGTVSVPGFAPGTRTAVIVVATKSDAAKPTVWSFDATDIAGHTTHCA